ncbi:type II secretion system protein [Janthinobacterium sp. J1-1]|uniref:type II secretion system protein n=1 Tax=unclassified Janthinobacterium TaxID=2610881 RepID=UPI0028125BBD|nr:type II secretion system protein [Janthinobacterium sp. J1-1]
MPISEKVVRGRRAGRGFTLFELAVVVSVIGILIVVLLSRMAFYRDEAERLAYEQTLTALRTEVQLQTYALMIAGRQKEIPALAGQNPMNWLAQKPPNYLGEIYSPDVKKLVSGNWFFDRSDGKLVYLLNKSNTFDAQGFDLLQFKVSLSQGAEITHARDTARVELVPLVSRNVP